MSDSYVGPREAAVPPPQRSVLGDGTYSAIRSMILEHRISPDSHISIDALARDLAVSQTPVREALARLESDRLVTKVPLKGYKSTSLPTLVEFDDMFQFRGLIEPWSAGRAASRTDAEGRNALADEMKAARALTEVRSYVPLIDHDTRFHALIARLSGNKAAEDAFARIHCHLHLFRLYNASQNLDPADERGAFIRELFATYYETQGEILAVSEHRNIADAILCGNAEVASATMAAHIEASRDRFAPAVEILNAMRAS